MFNVSTIVFSFLLLFPFFFSVLINQTVHTVTVAVWLVQMQKQFKRKNSGKIKIQLETFHLCTVKYTLFPQKKKRPNNKNYVQLLSSKYRVKENKRFFFCSWNKSSSTVKFLNLGKKIFSIYKYNDTKLSSTTKKKKKDLTEETMNETMRCN